MTCNHQVAGSNPAGGLISARISWTGEDAKNVIRTLKLAGDSDKHVKSIERRLRRFSEHCCYSCNLDDIIIYINEIKSKYSYSELHKTILAIRMLMREIEAPFADKIKLPKAPKRRRIVVKIKDLKRLLSQVEQLNYAMALRTKAAILLSATSGIRAEELYKLTLENIDIENRTIYITAEIAKDYEDRVTFFSEEAKTVLVEYLDNVKRKTSRLFPESNIKRALQQLNTKLRIKHMRKFFSQQSDRLGMPTAVKKILMGHSTRNDVDLSHYDFQDEEELKKIYDRYWAEFRILS